MVEIVKVSDPECLTAAAINDLYTAVGWTSYTNDLAALLAGIVSSDVVVAAFNAERLVGLCRVLTDFHTIAYVQDILVDPAQRRQGIATRLLECALSDLRVRQTVLLTDAETAQRNFYESCGFTEIRDFTDFQLRSFVKFA
ncbi:GNAT family N-acetyltransferase [Canibacter oris]|uniref:Ribosomal protein S18 acetylase RimI-like enzyme n=1 Tax=Canibacter oris TaxID=1365628 RepID=A0A840DF09_9MICO|nr:GNAT family N-acetyltransferase [Canibacter oris]MBB4071654.1 ribosomal protein S18 acetylase RimI-like enzyme [Canibacter oris]